MISLGLFVLLVVGRDINDGYNFVVYLFLIILSFSFDVILRKDFKFFGIVK